MQLRALSLTKRITLSIGVSFTVIAVSGVMINHALGTVISTQRMVKHTIEVKSQFDLLLAALVDIETGSRGFAVAGGAAFLEPYESGNGRFKGLIDGARTLVADNPAQVARLTELERVKEDWVNGPVRAEIEGRRAVMAGTMLDTEYERTFNEARGKALMDKMRGMIREMHEIESSLMAERETQYASAMRISRLWLGVGLGSAIALGAGLLIWVAVSASRKLMRISGGLDDATAEVSAAAGQVAGSSQSLAEGSSEQAASLEETSASLEEMSSMTRRNAEHAAAAKQLTEQTRLAAEGGVSQMQTMAAAMNDIKASSDNIAKIIKTIDVIAFQTNILALNAAVEAARAGEAGMGFAVVAEEVRSLAQRSASAARETAEKIEDAIRKSENGVQISSTVGSSLDEIVTKARRVDELVAEISTASTEQSRGIDQVTTAMAQMDKVTQSAAANAEETASAAEELSSQSVSMRELVAELLGVVKGDASAPVRVGPPPLRPQLPSSARDPKPHGMHGHPRSDGKAGVDLDLTYTLQERDGEPAGAGRSRRH